MNLFTVAGRIGNDPKLRQVSGYTCLDLSVAFESGFGDKKKTHWLRAQLWGKRADALAPYLVKGMQIMVAGELEPQTFTKQDGTPGFGLQLNVEKLTFGARPQGSPAPAAAPTTSAPQEPAGGFTENDIPF